MSDKVNSEQELSAIREDLRAIRSCLLRSGLNDAQELPGRLRSAVERFRNWTSVGTVDRESVAEIQRDLGELHPLFENAYALHSGWFGLLDLNEANGGGQYDSTGQQAAVPVPATVDSGRVIVHRG